MRSASQLPTIPVVPYPIAHFAERMLGYAHALDCRWEEIPSTSASALWCDLCITKIPVIQHHVSARYDVFLGHCRACRTIYWAIRIYLKEIQTAGA
jgi:hypothetical protein